MIGMMMSPTNEVTMAPNAAPMMTPTARSTTLPFIANSRNSFSMVVPLRTPGRRQRLISIDQAGVDHGIADHLAGRRRHVHQRQAHFLLHPSQQIKAMLGAGKPRLLEDGIMQ